MNGRLVGCQVLYPGPVNGRLVECQVLYPGPVNGRLVGCQVRSPDPVNGRLVGCQVLYPGRLVRCQVLSPGCGALVDFIDEARWRSPGLDYLVTGFAAHHPLVQAVSSRFRPRTYRSVIHLVHAADQGVEAAIRELDGRTPHLEVATP